MQQRRSDTSIDDLDGECWGRALRDARRLLGRWGDQETQRQRDDLVQDAAVALWRSPDSRRPGASWGALVHTIARRLRWRALRAARRAAEAVDPATAARWPGAVGDGDVWHEVDGRRVPAEWLLQRLAPLLAHLRPTNRRIVLAYYDGSSCAELGVQLGLSADAVKVRLHRSRTSLRKRLEELARAAGPFDA